MYYSSFGLLSIIIHVIINIEGLRKPQDPSLEPIRVYYRRFLLGVMLYYISDVLWGFLYDTGIVALAYADTVLYFFPWYCLFSGG